MADSMTPEERQAIRERVEAATEGPWYVTGQVGRNRFSCVTYGVGVSTDDHSLAREADVIAGGHDYETDEALGVLNDANAAFIAAARTDVPALLAEVEGQAGEIERLKAAIAYALHMIRDCDPEVWEYYSRAIEALDNALVPAEEATRGAE